MFYDINSVIKYSLKVIHIFEMGCRSCCYGPRAAIIAALIGSLLCVAFALIFHYFSGIFNKIAANLLVITPDSPAYPAWVDIPFDPIVEVYMFNYTNTEAFMNGTDPKPIVEQIGPYTYSLHLTKVFMNFNETPLVSYRQLHYYHFMPELSNGREDDWVIMPNLMSLIPIGMASDPMTALLFDLLLTKYPDEEPPFTKVQVGDFLVYGYKDEALKKAQDEVGFELTPDGRIGILYGKNGSDDRLYKMNTGVNDHDEMYHIVEWDGHKSMDYEWNDTYCGMLNGSDGTMFQPGLGKFDRLYIFISFLRRSIFFNYTNEMTFKGIDLNSYEIPIEFYGDYNMYPDNYCYSNGESSDAYASGVWYGGENIFGGKMYLSNPHFMGGDFKLVEDVEGMKPMGKDHAAQLSIIPEFGAPIQGKLRFQISILMRPGEGMMHTRDWPTVMLPIAWVNASVDLPDDMAADIVKYYYGGLKLFYSILIIFIVICGLVCLMGIFCSYKIMFDLKKELYRQRITQDNIFKMEETSTKSDENHEDKENYD